MKTVHPHVARLLRARRAAMGAVIGNGGEYEITPLNDNVRMTVPVSTSAFQEMVDGNPAGVLEIGALYYTQAEALGNLNQLNGQITVFNAAVEKNASKDSAFTTAWKNDFLKRWNSYFKDNSDPSAAWMATGFFDYLRTTGVYEKVETFRRELSQMWEPAFEKAFGEKPPSNSKNPFTPPGNGDNKPSEPFFTPSVIALCTLGGAAVLGLAFYGIAQYYKVASRLVATAVPGVT